MLFRSPFDANTWYEFETYEGLCVNFKNFGAEEKFSSRDQVGIRYKYYNLLTFEDHETSSYISNIDFSQNLTVITDWVTNLYYGSDYGSGITFPIQFIGTEAEVSLIVPSKVGNASDISSVVPLYYETITYYETYQD